MNAQLANYMNRQDTETAILTFAANLAIANGWTVSVWDGEAWPLTRSTDLDAILAATRSTDEETLRFRCGAAVVGSLFLVYGNDGHDVVADASCDGGGPFDTFTGLVQDYADSLA